MGQNIIDKLRAQGFSNEQIQQIAKVFAEEKAVDDSISRILEALGKDPASIINALKPKRNYWALAANTLISLAIIGTVFGLAIWEHLDKSQTATLLGGIIGYLLGRRGGE